MKYRFLCLLIVGASLVGLAGQAQTTFLTNGLIAYYPFDGNANDAVGTNDGVVVGATLTNDMFGNPNHAYLFNGTNYIQCTDAGFPSGSGDRTVCLWLELSSFGDGTTYPFGYGTVATDSAFYSYVDNLHSDAPAIALAESGNGTSVPRWHGVTTNIWYHLTITYSGSNSTAALYINGTNVAQTTRNFETALTGSFYIGAGFEPALPFYGAINNVRIYNRALSPDEVSNLYKFELGVVLGIVAVPGITI